MCLPGEIESRTCFLPSPSMSLRKVTMFTRMRILAMTRDHGKSMNGEVNCGQSAILNALQKLAGETTLSN
jgi:hypothetical protein